MQDILLITAGVLTALLTGVFFGFMVAVNPGLHRLKDSEYIKAMQSINTVIINPWFMLSFMGPVLLLPVLAFMTRGEAMFTPIIVAAALYIFGVFGITSGGNVPLNDKLAKVAADQAPSSELAAARAAYEKPWNQLHALRTILAIVATVCIFVAVLRTGL